jgi:hypothetical protein
MIAAIKGCEHPSYLICFRKIFTCPKPEKVDPSTVDQITLIYPNQRMFKMQLELKGRKRKEVTFSLLNFSEFISRFISFFFFFSSLPVTEIITPALLIMNPHWENPAEPQGQHSWALNRIP